MMKLALIAVALVACVSATIFEDAVSTTSKFKILGRFAFAKAEDGESSLSWEITPQLEGVQVCMFSDVTADKGIYAVWPEDEDRECSEYTTAAVSLSTSGQCVSLTKGETDVRSLAFTEQESAAYWWAALVNCREDIADGEDLINASYKLEFTNPGGVSTEQFSRDHYGVFVISLVFAVVSVILGCVGFSGTMSGELEWKGGLPCLATFFTFIAGIMGAAFVGTHANSGSGSLLVAGTSVFCIAIAEIFIVAVFVRIASGREVAGGLKCPLARAVAESEEAAASPAPDADEDPEGSRNFVADNSDVGKKSGGSGGITGDGVGVSEFLFVVYIICGIGGVMESQISPDTVKPFWLSEWGITAVTVRTVVWVYIAWKASASFLGKSECTVLRGFYVRTQMYFSLSLSLPIACCIGALADFYVAAPLCFAVQLLVHSVLLAFVLSSFWGTKKNAEIFPAMANTQHFKEAEINRKHKEAVRAKKKAAEEQEELSKAEEMELEEVFSPADKSAIRDDDGEDLEAFAGGSEKQSSIETPDWGRGNGPANSPMKRVRGDEMADGGETTPNHTPGYTPILPRSAESQV